MKERNTSNRLKEIMAKNGLRQIDILNKAIPFCKKYNVKLGRNDLSQYISGKVEPSQKKLTVLAETLEVNEAWLMGYDVPMEAEIKRQDNKSRIYFGLTLLELFRFYKMHIDNSINFKNFCKKIEISETRMLDFINYKDFPTNEEINKISKLYNIDSNEEFFNGDLYNELIEKNNGPWGLQMIKNSLSKEDYINQNNLALIVDTILPKEINLYGNTLDDRNKNEIIINKILVKNNLLTPGKKVTKSELEKIQDFLIKNVDYINSELNDNERKKINLEYSDQQFENLSKTKLIEKD